MTDAPDPREITPVDNPYRHDHNPLNEDFHHGICPACEWERDRAECCCTELGDPYCGQPECDIYYCHDCGDEFSEPCIRHEGVDHV